MSDQLSIYTVYDHPSDYPDKYVCRRCKIIEGGKIIDDGFLMISENLELIREQMLYMGLILIPRDASDDPVIIESYI